MVKKELYTCPRCNFQSQYSTSIKRHLFELKKTCPATKNNIELTDEIKNYIIDNRILPTISPPEGGAS